MSSSGIRFVFFSGNGLLACLEFRAFSGPVKYTVNGMSTSHPVIPSFKLLIDGDVNPNPGQDDNNNSQVSQVVIELPKSGLRIGQWNNSPVTNSKCEQIKFLLTSYYHRIDVLFLTETLLKSEVSDSLFPTPVFVLHRKDRPKKGGGILAFVSEKLKAGR